MIGALVNLIVRNLKGNEYQIDIRIPDMYLLSICIQRLLMLFRGKTKLISNDGMLFVGKGVTLRAKSHMKFGKGVTIADKCHIDALSSEGVSLGNNVSLGIGTAIECSGSLRHLGKGFSAENNVGLGRDCFYGAAGGIFIGEDTIVGNFVSMHSENHNSDDLDAPIRLQGVNHKGINIGKNCWIGAKVTVLDGVNLGSGCIIAAGAVLTAGNYPNNGVYGGVPARLLKQRKTHAYV